MRHQTCTKKSAANPADRIAAESEEIPDSVQFSPNAEMQPCQEFLSWSG
jgi:hypothetical protein